LNIWVYWEGNLNPFISLCLKSIRHHCGSDLQIVNDSFIDLLPKAYVHPNWRNITELGIRSDIVRASLLSYYGGVYLDADTICLAYPDNFISDRFLYSKWSTPPERFIAGYVSCPENSKVAYDWLQNINNVLAEDVKKAKWCALGEGCLTPAIKGNPPEESELVPLDTFLPIEIDNNVLEFFKPGDYRDYVTDNTFCFGLNNSWFASRKPRELTPPYQSNSVLHGLLRYADQL
jgi:hypothetical protein